MRVAAISDIHGNLPALEAVLDEIARIDPDLIVVCGDVAAGPMPRPTIERLMALGDRARFVRGNGDRYMVEAFDGVPFAPHTPPGARSNAMWCAAQIDRPQRDFLASFVDSISVSVDGIGDVLFCHATPTSDELIFTPATPDERLRALLAGVDAPLVVCGHTHMQFERTVGATRVVNAGSVGMPYGAAGAFWLLLGPDVERRRTEYDVEAAGERIAAAGSPDAGDFSAHNLRQRPPAEQVIALFEGWVRDGGFGSR